MPCRTRIKNFCSLRGIHYLFATLVREHCQMRLTFVEGVAVKIYILSPPYSQPS